MCFGFLAPPNFYYVDVDNVTKIYTIIEVIFIPISLPWYKDFFNQNLSHDKEIFLAQIFTTIQVILNQNIYEDIRIWCTVSNFQPRYKDFF